MITFTNGGEINYLPWITWYLIRYYVTFVYDGTNDMILVDSTRYNELIDIVREDINERCIKTNKVKMVVS